MVAKLFVPLSHLFSPSFIVDLTPHHPPKEKKRGCVFVSGMKDVLINGIPCKRPRNFSFKIPMLISQKCASLVMVCCILGASQVIFFWLLFQAYPPDSWLGDETSCLLSFGRFSGLMLVLGKSNDPKEKPR